MDKCKNQIVLNYNNQFQDVKCQCKDIYYSLKNLECFVGFNLILIIKKKKKKKNKIRIKNKYNNSNNNKFRVL